MPPLGVLLQVGIGKQFWRTSRFRPRRMGDRVLDARGGWGCLTEHASRCGIQVPTVTSTCTSFPAQWPKRSRTCWRPATIDTATTVTCKAWVQKLEAARGEITRR